MAVQRDYKRESRMNILVLASEYPYSKDRNPDRTKVVGYFAKEWIKQGHRVVVIVNSSRFPSIYYVVGSKVKKLLSVTHDNISQIPNKIWTMPFTYEENGVFVANLPILKIIPHGKFARSVIKRQISRITDILKEQNFIPNIVTGHWVNPQIVLVPALAKQFRARSAFVFHADYTKEHCMKFNVQHYIDQIDRIGFRSKSAVQNAKNYLVFRREPFVAVSGLPDEYITRYHSLSEKSFGESKLRIISASRLVEYKKLDVAISATVKAFPDRNFDFSIAGEGPLKDALIELLSQLDALSQFHLLGQVPRDELQALMHSSHIFVLVSKHETFGLVYLEAMLQGCIVIASKSGGIDGIIEDGMNGFLCEEGNEKELISILKRISKMSANDLSAMSNRAIATALSYSESAVARRYLQFIVDD